MFIFFNLSKRFGKNKRYSLRLGSRSLISVSSRILRSNKYISYFNHFKQFKIRRRRLRRYYYLRTFINNKKYFLLGGKVGIMQKLPDIHSSDKTYQLLKLKYNFRRNYIFSKLKKHKLKKKKYPSLLHLLSAQGPTTPVITKALITGLMGHKKLFSLFKLFLFSHKKIRRRKKKKKVKSVQKIVQKPEEKKQEKPKKKRKIIRLKKRNRFYILNALSSLYTHKNFSFNLFRRTAKCSSFIKRKKQINLLLPFNKRYNRKPVSSLLNRITYGFEVLGHKGPTTSQFVHAYKFTLLKLKKRVRYNFFKFHLLFPKMNSYYYHGRFIPYPEKPIKEKKKIRRFILNRDPRATLKGANANYYRIWYYDRSLRRPYHFKRFFKKKKALPIVNKFYPSLKPIKEKKLVTPKFELLFSLKDFIQTRFRLRMFSRYNKKLKYRKLIRKLLYRNLYSKFIVRRRLSLKLYMLNRYTNFYRVPTLQNVPVKSFNILLFLRPKNLIIFFKEKFSQLITFFEQSGFVDPIYFSRSIRLIRLSVERLKIIQTKNKNFKLLKNTFKFIKDKVKLREYSVSMHILFFSYFIGALKYEKPIKPTKPEKDYKNSRFLISERKRKMKMIGYIKKSLLAKQKRTKVNKLLRLRKDVWLQPEFIMLNFKNLLIKKGLGVRAEKLITELLLLRKFKHTKKRINYTGLFVQRRPLFGSKPKRRGSMIQYIPMLLTSKRSISESQRQLLKFAANRSERTLILRVYNECISTIQNRSSTSKALAEQYKSTFLNRVLL